MLDLDHGTSLLRLLSEPTRLRLLLLLAAQPLTVAEITQATGLAQSRVSTHLGRLRAAELVHEYRSASGNGNNAALLAVDPGRFEPRSRQLWGVFSDNLGDPLIEADLERAAEIARRRAHKTSWAESVAGSMERHYSPGRSWEATAHALIGLADLGDVLDVGCGDGVLADLVGARAASVTCLDASATVLAAARKRLARRANVAFHHGDMHTLPFTAARFDHVFLMHALTYSEHPELVLAEAARVLRPGGALVLATLARHRHRATVAAFDHVNLGFAPDELRDWASQAGLDVALCAKTSREGRAPYFEVVTLIARRAAAAGRP